MNIRELLRIAYIRASFAFFILFSLPSSPLLSPPCLADFAFVEYRGLDLKEDAYLREQYPLYAGTSSAFAVLGAADEMEAKQRSEEQIKARVKKLGLTAAHREEIGNGSGDNPDDGVSLGAESDEEDTASNTRSAKAVHVRKLQRKSQAESEEDSEGLFSSTEVRSCVVAAQYLSDACTYLCDEVAGRNFRRSVHSRGRRTWLVCRLNIYFDLRAFGLSQPMPRPTFRIEPERPSHLLCAIP